MSYTWDMGDRKPRSSVTTERPLAPQARGMLVFAAAVTMLAFYAAAVLSMVFLSALLLLLAIVALGAARVGASAYVTPLMGPPNRLLQILLRNLWLPTAVDYRIRLQPSDAPRLFELVGNLARRMEVKPPSTVVVEMHSGAWVMLKGFVRASGDTTLGIGFDLLAGLTIPEIEAVLAHELAHARLVQRGFSRWLNKGIARLAAVAQQMSGYAAERRNADKRSDLAEWGTKLFDALTVRAARHVATYSRQDEFEADRTAAETCGPFAMRSALITLHGLDDATSRLPWGERIARLQPGEKFTHWLVAELARMAITDADEPVRHAADPYSTHPTLRDRISALAPDDRTIGSAATGVELLADPDGVAARLVAEIERVALKEEKRHTKKLARESTKLAKRETSGGLQLVGLIAAVFGVIIGVIVAAGDLAVDGVAIAIASLAVGIALYRAGAYRDRRMLPTPVYGTLTAKPFETHEQLVAAEKAIYAELQGEAEKERTKRGKVSFLITVAYTALEQREYLRAHVAARQALEIKDKSVEANLAYAIAAAAIGNAEQTQRALAMVRNQAGFTSPATKWGAAWAMVMLEDWSCEGFLQQLHEREPGVATYAALLSLAQGYRGKLQCAMQNGRTASALEPQNDAITQLLVHTLLQSGRVREAAERVAAIEDKARVDPDAAFLMVRVKLMMRDLPVAEEWARVLRGLDKDGRWLIALGGVFTSARLEENAGTFFLDALATAYTPQANVGLSVLAVIGGDRERAKQHLLAALKIEDKRLTGGSTPGTLFHEVVGRLNGLAERRVACKAWIAAIPGDSQMALSGVSLFVCAPDEEAAKAHVAEIILAMDAKDAALDLSTVAWSEAPQEQQPLRPVQQGVQFLIT